MGTSKISGLDLRQALRSLTLLVPMVCLIYTSMSRESASEACIIVIDPQQCQ